MRTSVYLSNRNLQIAIGDTKNKKVNIERLYNIDIQEGNLINGVITNQEGLKRQLEELWSRYEIPRTSVELTVDSTQIATKVLEIPKMKEKSTYELIQKEFSNIDNPSQYTYDYRIIRRDTKAKTVRILAAAANRNLIQSYIDLFKEMKIEVDCIDISQNGILKTIELNSQVTNENFMITILDGDNLVNTLIVDGQYKLFERNRIFNERGTREFAVEIGKNMSSLLQFLSSEDKDKKVEDVYLGGFERGDQEECNDVIRSLGLRVVTNYELPEYNMPAMDQMVSTYDLGAASNPVMHYLFAVGNLISYKKDLNFASRIMASETKEADENLIIKIFAGVCAVCVIVSVGLFGFNLYQQSKLEDCNTFLQNKSNSEKYNKGKRMEAEVTKKQGEIHQLANVEKILDTYPEVDIKVEREMKKCAGSQVSMTFASYDATTGTYEFTARANKVTSIYDFISKLGKTKLFANLKYSGYNYTDSTRQYDIKVTGSLSEDAGK